MRRILRKIAEGDTEDLGDISTLADPGVVESLVEAEWDDVLPAPRQRILSGERLNLAPATLRLYFAEMSWLPFEFSLALRYLRPKRTAVSFITLISVVGVMLGAVLIIVTSVFSGFHLQLKKTFFQFSADVQVRQVVDDGFGGMAGVPITDYDDLAKRWSHSKASPEPCRL